MDERKVTAVIPALNEQDTILEVLKGIKPYVDEVVVVDDGSTDRTAEIARAEQVTVLSNGKNLGYEQSIDRGFKLAAQNGATVLLTFDGDGQHNPEDIPKIVEPILRGESDIVVGARPHYPRITEHLFAVIAMKKAGIRDPLCGLKGYHVKVYQDIGCFDRNRSVGVQFIFSAKEKGYRILQHDVLINQRKDESRFGKSLEANWKIFKAILKTM